MYGRFGENKKVFAPTGIRIPDYPVRNQFSIPTTVSRLQFFIVILIISGLGFLIRKVKRHNYELKDLLERTSNSVIVGRLLSQHGCRIEQPFLWRT